MILVRGLEPNPNWAGAMWFLLAGVCATGPGRLLFQFSIKRIGVSRASVLLTITPLIQYVELPLFFLGERPGWTLVAGAILIVLGIMNVIGDRSGIRVELRAAVLGLIPALFYSLSPVFSRLGIEAIPDRLLGNALTALGVLVFMFSSPPLIPKENRWKVNLSKLWIFPAGGVVYAMAFYAFLHHHRALFGEFLNATDPYHGTFFGTYLPDPLPRPRTGNGAAGPQCNYRFFRSCPDFEILTNQILTVSNLVIHFPAKIPPFAKVKFRVLYLPLIWGGRIPIRRAFTYTFGSWLRIQRTEGDPSECENTKN